MDEKFVAICERTNSFTKEPEYFALTGISTFTEAFTKIQNKFGIIAGDTFKVSLIDRRFIPIPVSKKNESLLEISD